MTTAWTPQAFHDVDLRIGGWRVRVRKARPSDKKALLACLRLLPQEEWPLPSEGMAPPRLVQRWTADPVPLELLPIVAETSGEGIVGAGSLRVVVGDAGGKLADISILVAPAHRRRGLGLALLRALVEAAADLKLTAARIVALDRRHDAAMRLARVLGFANVRTRPQAIRDTWGNFQDVVEMELELAELNLWWRES